MLVDFPANRGLFSPLIRWGRQEEKRSLPTAATVFDLKRRPRRHGRLPRRMFCKMFADILLSPLCRVYDLTVIYD